MQLTSAILGERLEHQQVNWINVIKSRRKARVPAPMKMNESGLRRSTKKRGSKVRVLQTLGNARHGFLIEIASPFEIRSETMKKETS